MSLSLALLFVVSLAEILLLVVVLCFFRRLRKTEALLNKLQQNQEEFLRKLHFNAELEQELVSSFEKRQAELSDLDKKLGARTAELEALMKQAGQVVRSPRLFREIVLQGREQGRSAKEMALSLGLSVDEVELILEQAKT